MGLVGLGLERDGNVLDDLVALGGEVPHFGVLVFKEVAAVLAVALGEELLLHVLHQVVEAPVPVVDGQAREGDLGGGDAERLVDREREHLAHEARVLDRVLDVQRAVAVEGLAVDVLVEVDLDRGLFPAARALAARADTHLLDDLPVDRHVGGVVLVGAEVIAQRLPVGGVDHDADLVEHARVEDRVRRACGRGGEEKRGEGRQDRRPPAHDSSPATAFHGSETCRRPRSVV